MNVTRFEDLTVWQKSKDLSVAIYRVTARGGFARDSSLRGQVRRAAVSVMSNIAEGFGRYTKPEIRRFVSIARGSVAEVQSQLYLARDLGYLAEQEHRRLNALCLEVARMLSSFRSSLDEPPSTKD